MGWRTDSKRSQSMKWVDATSYSREERLSERKPRAWRFQLTPDCSIWVGSEHIYHRGEWAMTCFPWFEAKSLDMPANKFTAEQAQEKALAIVIAKVQKLAAALDKVKK